MARAMKPLEATLALQPTLILTNSLPCSLDVIVWQVGLQICRYSSCLIQSNLKNGEPCCCCAMMR